MSSLEMRRVSREDIQLVQNLIERCLQLYMNQKEVMETLLEQAKIEPGFTELVWQKLEEENRDFFKAYYLRLMVKQQIMEYNKLLEQQASDQSSLNLSSAYLNGGSALNTNIPSSVDFSTHSRRVDPSPNMPLMQGMVKSETAFSNCDPYMYATEAPSAVRDASIASFSNDSSNQSLNDPLVDADDSTFGFLGQIPRNFSLSDLTADFSQGSGPSQSHICSPFFPNTLIKQTLVYTRTRVLI
ncbi:unnamed protein product [Arabis nemorensis]|uniref:Angiotensin-converting enzyme 2 n=1 Tax=Arabis nemorensis TaxID=586526 RepID=A0A565CHD1_9BRAS|nr:unnamed protein product [Arabis nemorensis]